MNSFEAIRLVAWRELRERGRSKAYIVSTIFTLILLGGAIALPALFGGDPTTYQVGIVGEGGEPIVSTASALAGERAGEEEPDDFETTVFEDLTAAETALDEGEIEAILVDGQELVVPGTGNAFGGPGGSMTGLLQEAAGTRRVQDLVASNEEAAEVLELLASEPLEVRNLNGAEDNEAELRGLIAFVGLILMYIAVLTYGSWMLSGVTEEKTNRVVEVLLSTLRPWQIFAGKLVGIGLLGLGQLVILLTVAMIGLRITNAFDVPSLPLDSVVALVGWFILGFVLYATLFGAAGALVSRMEDAQSAAAPLSILAVVGYFLSFQALNEPDGVVAVVGTFIPFTAPYVAPIRLALRTIEPWEMILAVLITVGSIVVMVRLAGRVYAGGLLRFGGRMKWREAFRSAE
ncbi:MAG TPA: ABC transporter permease [Acidimicrobiia bacterium]|nr:ABC transporter permease [Acidimicrobiia bacterium]